MMTASKKVKNEIAVADGVHAQDLSGHVPQVPVGSLDIATRNPASASSGITPERTSSRHPRSSAIARYPAQSTDQRY
jgi:hypothetical protein